MDLGILAGESLGTTSVPRLELFLDAVGSLIRDHGMSTHMYINILVQMRLGDWQQAHPDIESPFTREETMESCAELQSRDDFE
jgi:proline dehydrogenase